MNRGRGRSRATARRIQQSSHLVSSGLTHLSTSSQSFQRQPLPASPKPQQSLSDASHLYRMPFTYPPVDPAPTITAQGENTAHGSDFQYPLDFDSPTASMASNGPSLRKRSRAAATSLDGSADDDSLSKGGHSLRKRARVDYTQEQVDDDLASHDTRYDFPVKLPSSTSARARRRRTTYDFSDADSDDVIPSHRRRGSEKSPTVSRGPSARRKTGPRKAQSSIHDYLYQPSDDVQDTILVGVSMEELEHSDLQSSPQQSEHRPSDSSEAEISQGQKQPTVPDANEELHLASASRSDEPVSVHADDGEAKTTDKMTDRTQETSADQANALVTRHSVDAPSFDTNHTGPPDQPAIGPILPGFAETSMPEKDSPAIQSNPEVPAHPATSGPRSSPISDLPPEDPKPTELSIQKETVSAPEETAPLPTSVRQDLASALPQEESISTLKDESDTIPQNPVFALQQPVSTTEGLKFEPLDQVSAPQDKPISPLNTAVGELPASPAASVSQENIASDLVAVSDDCLVSYFVPQGRDELTLYGTASVIEEGQASCTASDFRGEPFTLVMTEAQEKPTPTLAPETREKQASCTPEVQDRSASTIASEAQEQANSIVAISADEKPTMAPDRVILERSASPVPIPQTEIICRETKAVTVPSPAESLRPQKPRPRRLRPVELIYQSHMDADNNTSLVPYEKEEVAYPSPWIEYFDPLKTISASTPTLAAGVVLADHSPLEVMWDGLRPLKTKEFFRIYRAEMVRRKEKGQPQLTLQEFRRMCSVRRKAALDMPPESPPPPPKKGRRGRGAAALNKSRKKGEAAVVNDADSTVQTLQDTPRASPAPEPTRRTPPPPPRSPEVADDDAEQNEPHPEVEYDGQNAQDGDVVDDEPDSDAEVGGPSGPREITRYPRKQYSFPKVTDVSVFNQALQDYEEMDTPTLYETLVACAQTLQAWQEEWRELKKITDDEENAKRRQANDKTIENWDKRQKLDELPSWRRTFDDSFQRFPAPFELKGIRAPAPYVDDPVLEYQRNQDRIMAQAYGFMHNNHSNYIGRQRPEEQRYETEETENETRLRERKQTQRAADAADDGIIIEGKRARKPRILGDQSQQPSRASTPAPSQRPRRKRNAAPHPDANNGDDASENGVNAFDQTSEVSKRRGRGRGRGRANQGAFAVAGSADSGISHIQERTADAIPHATRKGGRAFPQMGPHTTNEPNGVHQTDRDLETSKPRRQRNARGQAPGVANDIPPGSFYSNASSAETQVDSRPSSSSSVATVHTAESSYSLRDKRKRNFAYENDPDFETRPKKRTKGGGNHDIQAGEAAKDKRRKKVPNVAPPTAPYQIAGHGHPNIAPAPAPAPMMHTFSAAPSASSTPIAKKPPTKIKFINGSLGSSSRGLPPDRSSKAAAAESGAAEAEEKPYSEMSKSEKMSYSMRRRWARGEMQGAVEKRKNTLAKKAEAKTTSADGQQKPIKTGKQKNATASPSAPPSSEAKPPLFPHAFMLGMPHSSHQPNRPGF